MVGTEKLSDADVTSRLATLGHWVLDEKKLFREFRFKDFSCAFGFMASVATIAQAMDHHPDWYNSYDTVRVHLTSHDVQGLSERDFVLAKKMNGLAANFTG